jgi:hypothetical protein
MVNPMVADRCAGQAPGWRLCALLALAWMMGSTPALASCFLNPDPTIGELETLVSKDAAKALKRATTAVQALQRQRQPDAQRIAALYAVQAQAYSILELDDDAKQAATTGLKFATEIGSPVQLDLLSTYAQNVYDSAGMSAALKSIEAARLAQPVGSLADTCLLITRGLLQYRQDRPDLAINSLTQAYHASAAPGFEMPRILCAAVMSTVMRSTGDYAQALALNQEVIDWDTREGATLALSVSRFLRGKILNLMGQYAAALEQFTAARKLSVQLDDSQGIAFADMLACSARIELGVLDRAASECGNALLIFTQAHAADEVKEAKVLLARIDLLTGHADKALTTLNEVLDQAGADLLPGRVAPLYQWRARAYAALHDYRNAYGDLSEYARRYAAANDAERIKVAAALRARFETDREIERNSQLKRELGASREQSQRQAQALRWNAIAATLAVLVIAMLVYFLFVNRRFRQQLVKLASRTA